MYWRVRNLTPEHLARQYGVHAALIVSVLCNLGLFITRPNPKNVNKEQKANYEQFVKTVTHQIIECTSYLTFEQAATALVSGELAPSVVSQFKEAGTLPKSGEEAQVMARELTNQRQITTSRIDSVNTGEPDAQGLLPVEVSGVIASYSAAETGSSAPKPFTFRFKVGNSAKTQTPIVAGFQEQ